MKAGTETEALFAHESLAFIFSSRSALGKLRSVIKISIVFICSSVHHANLSGTCVDLSEECAITAIISSETLVMFRLPLGAGDVVFGRFKGFASHRPSPTV
jgi:hypothetical protein